MRKRIAIGSVAVVALGVLLFLLTQPRKGSLEWHKQGYQHAMDRWEGRTFADRCKRLLAKVSDRFAWQIDAAEGHALAEKLDEHRAALIDMGYLVERTFTTTNDTGAFHLIHLEVQRLPKENRRFAWIAGTENRGVTVIGRREDLPKWGEMIHKLDATISSNNNASARSGN